MFRLDILTGEYPPASGGVGDYTYLLAHALAARDCTVHVWSPHVDDEPEARVRLHRLPDMFGPRSTRTLDEVIAGGSRHLLLQYVPNALGLRGANIPFCWWLWRASRRGANVRVMFHEPYFYFSANPPRDALALAQRAMAALLLRAASRVYVSTETWTRYLRPWAPAPTSFVPLAIPSTVGQDASPEAVRHWRATFTAAGAAYVVGHFGSFGKDVVAELRAVVPAVLRANPFAAFACIGRNSTWFAAALAESDDAFRDRIIATGPLESAPVAAAVQACDVLLQPYPDGVTTRRTSVMAPLACGVATVTTDGPLTEPIWLDTDAARLVPPSDPVKAAAAVTGLLADERARAALAHRGREIYETRFAIEHSVARLLGELVPAA